uniref:Uncharacterized protein n=1 Tax=Vespula pensylvanica TaxID=30213 RepID=A0A834NZV6_VESPE|nr:hypothetical protein H0235_008504 [Vespula pensylvanica]
MLVVHLSWFRDALYDIKGVTPKNTAGWLDALGVNPTSFRTGGLDTLLRFCPTQLELPKGCLLFLTHGRFLFL